MYNNYIASKVSFEDLDGHNCTVVVNNKHYHWRGYNDPKYQDDGVLDISYWDLFTEDDEATNMVLAFDKRTDGCDEPQEWADEYDYPYVLVFC
jgi:hypothetical protein